MIYRFKASWGGAGTWGNRLLCFWVLVRKTRFSSLVVKNTEVCYLRSPYRRYAHSTGFWPAHIAEPAELPHDTAREARMRPGGGCFSSRPRSC